MKLLGKSLVGCLLAAAVGAAFAAPVVYDNSATKVDGWHPFGSPDTTTYGEVFTLSSAATLDSWTFYAGDGGAGNLRFGLAAFNGSTPVGPSLYTSGILTYAGGAQALTASSINQTLAAGEYYAYITTFGVAGPVSDVGIDYSANNTAIGLGMDYNNSGGGNPFTSGSWSGVIGNGAGLAFTATFDTPAHVPEPATLALSVLGLAAAVAASRKRKSQ